ncbi:hypothetical protein CEP54_004191 [Fusarium duplospermum]|uniref:Uncharacterized protein n=1 Tax=Fusarium duplospermum TaxID=1325734 RepID=A0A428QJB5_9HYPO|nr:hypothetical protein CEP54_004191 [Fusarium duplospermum]
MEEARLVDDLSQRLSELEHKVQTFRHEVASDFLRYYHDLLRDIHPDVASSIRQSLAKSLPNYPDLTSALTSLDLEADSRAFARPGSGQRHLSPPTAASTTSGSGAAEPPGSPRDRHQELHGLFTPSYLPLLESSPMLPISPPLPNLPSPPLAMLLPEPGIRAEEQQQAEQQEQGADMGHQPGLDELQSGLPALPQSPARPGHVRRATDDTTSSGHSDRSESKTPRSALRRSSSASRPPHSPRRVRFDVMGAEVLPTASPQPTDFMIPPAVPAPPIDEPGTDSMLYDEFEEQAPPRKISSSEALRALSRAPLEDGTVWTLVNSNTDQTAAEQRGSVTTSQDAQTEERSSPMLIAPEPPSAMYIPESVRIERTLGSVSEEPEEDTEQDNSSDDEFLSMAKPKSFTNKKPPGSPSLAKSPEESKPSEPIPSPKSPVKPQGSSGNGPTNAPDDSDGEEDDLFHFEAGGLSAPPKPQPKPLVVQEEEPEVELPDVPESEQSLYATSPAVHITKRDVSSGPTTPTATRFQVGSLGSYKGRPVIMPVVRNPEVHAQAASLGNFNTFVGGLDGRSGMDEGDLNSFRASVANTGFSGTPRSFTERLMMEEAQKARAGGARLP